MNNNRLAALVYLCITALVLAALAVGYERCEHDSDRLLECMKAAPSDGARCQCERAYEDRGSRPETCR